MLRQACQAQMPSLRLKIEVVGTGALGQLLGQQVVIGDLAAEASS